MLDFIIVYGALLVASLPFREESEVDGEVQTTLPVGFLVLSIFVVFGYELVFVAWRGRTPGKMTMRLRIVDNATGEPLALRQASMRAAVIWLVPAALGLFIPFPFGLMLTILVFASAFWDRDRRNWPDKAASSRVELV